MSTSTSTSISISTSTSTFSSSSSSSAVAAAAAAAHTSAPAIYTAVICCMHESDLSADCSPAALSLVSVAVCYKYLQLQRQMHFVAVDINEMINVVMAACTAQHSPQSKHTHLMYLLKPNIFNRPYVARTVLQTALLLSH